jgi:hypothetical protein
MRVVRMTDLPVVIRVETPREVVVALPRTEHPHEEVLTLASLVLSSAEFEELQRNLAQSPATRPGDTDRARGAGEARRSPAVIR